MAARAGLCICAATWVAACSPQHSYQPYIYTSPSTPTPSASSAPKGEQAPPGGWSANKIKLTKEMQAAVENAVRNELKDPGSAQFKHLVAFKEKDGSIAACGQVNAKNSYGGYVGFTPFRAFVVNSKGKYVGVGALMGGGKYPHIFYEVATMCNPKNW